MPRKAKNTVAANVEAIAALLKRMTDEITEARKTNTPVAQREWKIRGAPGLSLTMKPSGVAIYYTRFMAGEGVRRKQIRKALGQANGPTAIKLSEAKEHALRVAKDGPQAYGNDAEPNITLRALFEKYEEFNTSPKNDRPLAPHTLTNYRAAFERDVFKSLGNVPVDQITAKDIAKLLAKVEARSRNSAHKCRAVFGSLYKWAAKRLLVEKNVTTGMGYSHKGKPRGRRLSDDEIARMWRTIDSHEFGGSPAMRRLLKLAILTGQRNSEVAGAQRSELHIADKVANPHWHIPGARMKRKNRDQWVFLSSQARQLFADAVAAAGGSKFVFPAQYQGQRTGRDHIMQESVSFAWKRARKLAGVKNAHLHDMRATITSWLGDRGERSDVLDRILHHQIGHHTNQRNSVTEQHYNFSVMAEPLRDAWQRWADHVTSVVRGDAAGSNVVRITAKRAQMA